MSLPCLLGWEAEAAQEGGGGNQGNLLGRAKVGAAWEVMAQLGGHSKGPACSERAAAQAWATVVEDIHQVPPGLQCDFKNQNNNTLPSIFALCEELFLPIFAKQQNIIFHSWSVS